MREKPRMDERLRRSAWPKPGLIRWAFSLQNQKGPKREIWRFRGSFAECIGLEPAWILGSSPGGFWGFSSVYPAIETIYGK